MADIYRRLGARVRQERARLGWTQEELGARCGMHASYIGQIERGVKKISLAALDRLASALRLSAADLLGGVREVLGDPWESRIGGLLRDCPDDQRRVLYTTLRTLAKEIRRKK